MAGHSFNKVVRVKKWEERQQITAISKVSGLNEIICNNPAHQKSVQCKKKDNRN
jgi:hypothetical protein